MDFELEIMLPYPETEGKIKNREMVYLYDLYAGRFSKLTSITTYLYQSIVLKSSVKTAENLFGNSEFCKIIGKLVGAKVKQFEILGKAIYSFGGDPIFSGRNNYFSTSYTSYIEEPSEMILYDIEMEKDSISRLKEILDATENVSLRELCTRILLDDELHQGILAREYEKFFK